MIGLAILAYARIALFAFCALAIGGQHPNPQNLSPHNLSNADGVGVGLHHGKGE